MRSSLLFLIAAGSIAVANPVPYADDETDNLFAAANVPDSNYDPYNDNIAPTEEPTNTGATSYKPVDNTYGNTEEISYNTGVQSYNTGDQPTTNPQDNSLELAGNTQHPAFINPKIDLVVEEWIAAGLITAGVGLATAFSAISKLLVRDTPSRKYQPGSVAARIQKLCNGGFSNPVCSSDRSNIAPNALKLGSELHTEYTRVENAFTLGDAHCGKGTDKNPIWPMCCQQYSGIVDGNLGYPATNCYIVTLSTFESCVNSLPIVKPTDSQY